MPELVAGLVDDREHAVIGLLVRQHARDAGEDFREVRAVGPGQRDRQRDSDDNSLTIS